jgi:hypothetical protein
MPTTEFLNPPVGARPSCCCLSAAAKAAQEAGEGGDEAAGASADAFEFDTASPAVAPQGKVRRMRPSPFHKESGVAAAAGAAKAERKKAIVVSNDEVRTWSCRLIGWIFLADPCYVGRAERRLVDA